MPSKKEAPKAAAAAESGKLEEALFKRMVQGSDMIKSKEQAIRIAKGNGWVKQVGDNLALTEEGRKHAREAKRHLEGKSKPKEKT